MSPDAGGVARAKMFMEAMTSMSDPRRPLNISLGLTTSLLALLVQKVQMLTPLKLVLALLVPKYQ